MHYNIKGTGLAVSDEIRSYIEKRLPTIEKYTSDADARVDVELEYLKDEAKMYRAELMFHTARSAPMRSEARGATLHESIDIAIGDLSRELSQHKKKRRDIFRRGAAKVKAVLRGWY